MRLLFISPAELDRPRGGRELLGRVHRDALQQLVGDAFATHRLVAPDAGGLVGRARGYLDGATPAGIAASLSAIERHRAETVWLDGSNLGRLAQAIKRARPAIRVASFCHNVEARFFLGALRHRSTPRAAGVLLGNYVAERLALRHSDDVIALSERDSAGFRRLYRRGATAILPMALTDQLSENSPGDAPVDDDAPFLFVGGSFYANKAGILWFARHVAPHITARIEVVGHGMEQIRGELEKAPNIRVIGSAGSLEPHYRAARAVIAPIFDGSGMKTKVAEALMFGKRVIGSAEAFSGYEALGDNAGWRCETANAFVRAIGAAQEIPTKEVDPELRALYERDYSAQGTERRLEPILGRSELAVRGAFI